jgi:hypothetical protein
LEPEEGLKSLMNIILDVTKESISSRREGRTHLVPKPKRSLKQVSRKFANVSIDELVTFLGIQMLISYRRLPELSMYWEQQLDSGNVLGIIYQVMSRAILIYLETSCLFSAGRS